MGSKARKVRVSLLVERDGVHCTWCCREMIDLPITLNQDCSLHMTLEHVVPLAHGGTHELLNLALACFQCNNARGDDRVEFNPPWSLV